VQPDKKLILIVEDNPETAFVYSRYLSGAGFQTHTVASVEGAKAVIEKIRPAALILDVLLRSETSWNFLRELKSEARPIPVLVMSITDDEHKVYGLGADAFLRKPYVPEQMIAEIARMTSESQRPRILMIDDNEVSRYLLRGNISESQYEVFEARAGREGLQMARELKPSLIFLDFYMPDLNGSEVLKDLRSSEELSGTPIILHSTKALDEADMRFFQEHDIAIFSKQALTQPDAAVRLRELMNTLAAHARMEKNTNA
jgi:CheY-like chemotaxis protein